MGAPDGGARRFPELRVGTLGYRPLVVRQEICLQLGPQREQAGAGEWSGADCFPGGLAEGVRAHRPGDHCPDDIDQAA